ncbi:YkgJ family cysteine cluster protein [Bdellovibrio sp. NC01]|uniref:YkgJ family cysteine cluster protein n=1 Tax=Bdellovibrio sp. NC01 TaxID=2220073 RepID=UPI001157A92C|nr:YkgJ family cysteine cluster protein [Bdellovibrio sp. NC01]QDK38722.1 hypothetical protein DOE51_14570 [Bdellovibrio sp. NC01]
MTADSFFQRHSKLTRSLKKFVLDFQQQLPEDTFAAFLVNLDEELQKYSQQLLLAPAGPARARLLQSLVDQEINSEKEIQVSCTKGCSACCHMEVEVTSYEADILHKLVTDGHAIDRERLKQQSQRKLQDPLWFQGPKKSPESRCVFLNDEGACSIYENRPVMCRRHSVTTPAKNCEDLNEKITVRYFPRVDLLISAANEDLNVQVGPLAKMLQMKLHEEIDFI